jgi:hypothetical protein
MGFQTPHFTTMFQRRRNMNGERTKSDGGLQAPTSMLTAYTHTSPVDWNDEVAGDGTGVWRLVMR